MEVSDRSQVMKEEYYRVGSFESRDEIDMTLKIYTRILMTLQCKKKVSISWIQFDKVVFYNLPIGIEDDDISRALDSSRSWR
jgi:hypothetical protein